jgi:serine/threonine protein kinase
MGTVRLAKSKELGGYVVVKIIKKEYVARHNDQRHINNERKIMAAMSSSFCVKLFSSFQDNKCIYFVMEYAPGGELFRRISKKNALKAQEARFYTVEIFSALEHVHSLGYVYRDLKPENVMIDADGHCKLIDFGFATQPDAKTGLMKTTVGTPAYLSPEQLNGKFTNGYTSIVDWWSLGIFLYELLTCKTPFCKNPKESHYDIYLRILKSKGISFPRAVSDPASRDIVSKLCHPNVESRLRDPADIKEHEYFDVDWAAVTNRRLIPPFVPKLRSEKEGDDYYFDVDYGEEPEPPERASGSGSVSSVPNKSAHGPSGKRHGSKGNGAAAGATADQSSNASVGGGSGKQLLSQSSTRNLGSSASVGTGRKDDKDNHAAAPAPPMSSRAMSSVRPQHDRGSKTKVNDGCWEFDGF